MALKKTLAAFCMAAACSVAMAAPAQGIAVVDLQSVLEKSAKFESVKKNLKSQFAAQSQALEKEQETLFKSLDAFRKNKSTMKKGEAEKKQKALMERQSQLAKKQQQFSEQVQKAQGDAMSKLYASLQKIVTQEANASKVSVVLLKQAVVVSNAPDLTSQVEKAFAAQK